jgi:alpha-glucosidase
MAHVSGDVDGIFGGSPDTYTRDLQYKCFMTTMMVMSGWAQNPDKQPWTWGEPYSSINRMYLKIKSRLTPYYYTLSREAYDTGVPPVRAMAFEFPEDPMTYTNWTGTAYQFMAGPSILVAPVYENATTRDGIYLPAGEW